MASDRKGSEQQRKLSAKWQAASGIGRNACKLSSEFLPKVYLELKQLDNKIITLKSYKNEQRSEQIFSYRRHTDSQQVLHISHQQGNANQNHNEISSQNREDDLQKDLWLAIQRE
jgi:hypothetical protein